MNFVLTLVASDQALNAGHIARIEHVLDQNAIALTDTPVWLARHKAADLFLAVKPGDEVLSALRTMLRENRIDLFVSQNLQRRKKLLIADMDSTIISGETLDELAVHAGKQKEIATVTKLAMEGQLDFKQALTERVGKLAGLADSCLQTTLDHTALNPGAQALVKTMAKDGALCVLVSGGFTFFTAAIAKQAGFHHHHGNELEIADHKLTGKVREPILDKDAKLSFLNDYLEKNGLTPEQAITIGDGANDLPMLTGAGLGIGYHPKPLLMDALDNLILYGDLSAALYAQGYRQEGIIHP